MSFLTTKSNFSPQLLEQDMMFTANATRLDNILKSCSSKCLDGNETEYLTRREVLCADRCIVKYFKVATILEEKSKKYPYCFQTIDLKAVRILILLLDILIVQLVLLKKYQYPFSSQTNISNPLNSSLLFFINDRTIKEKIKTGYQLFYPVLCRKTVDGT